MIKHYPGFKVYWVGSSTGYAGMDGSDILVLDENHTESELDDRVWELAIENAEMYGIYHQDYYPDEAAEQEADEDGPDWRDDEYTDAIEGWYEEYDPEKHDMLVPGGSSWESEIQRQLKYF